jgi:beta-1,4-mannosyl-glycoprotein beta-1,4-N-acetylglucosaminyltransferase
MIYDCFSFFGSEPELDLLELRLHELDKVVDYFVLVEATRTHSGNPKPLYYNENRDKFYDFHRKMIHIIVDDMPMIPQEIMAAITKRDRNWLAPGYQIEDNWVRERFQRNQIMRGLIQCEPDDIIIIGDADEIVRPSVLESIYNVITEGSNCVMQTMNSYYMNVQCVNGDWAGSKILRYKFITSPSEDRFHTPASNVIYNGGWHMQYLGGAEAIKTKIRSFAHQEYNAPGILNGIEQRLASLHDVLGRPDRYKVIPIDENMPKYVLEHLDKFEKYMYRGA